MSVNWGASGPHVDGRRRTPGFELGKHHAVSAPWVRDPRPNSSRQFAGRDADASHPSVNNSLIPGRVGKDADRSRETPAAGGTPLRRVRALATDGPIPGAGGAPWESHRLVSELASRGEEAIAVRLLADDATAGWSE
jgi:hypothetical protein